MKKTYVTPDVEKVAFQYRDQVVAASIGGGTACTQIWENFGSYEAGSPCKITSTIVDSGITG